MMELEVTTLHRYHIERRLAKGGMSMVYLATDQQTGQPVAIKVVHSMESDEVKRFIREVKTLTQLKHEHILPVLDYGVQGCWHYLVMPFIEGGTLRNRLMEGLLTQEEAGSILIQVAEALDCAHEQGILHRDIKPSNILLENGKYAYLADFGLAKEFGKDRDEGYTATLTQTGCLIGTPEYMAPELAEETATVRSDVYSLGIVLYQMLTGQTPFKGGTPMAIYWKQMKELPVPPSALNPAIAPAVERVVLHALEKDPELRFASAQEVAKAYEAALKEPVRADSTTLPVLLPPVQRIVPVATLGRPVRSRRAVYGTLVALLFLFAIPLWLGFSAWTGGYMRQAPNVLGANIQGSGAFFKLSEKPIQFHPQATPTKAPTTEPTHANWSPPARNVSTAGDHGHTHGHKHGHKHGG